jgi:hypothetical protein
MGFLDGKYVGDFESNLIIKNIATAPKNNTASRRGGAL